ncbi:MAG TPA: hypothetical protein VLZ05_15685 [Mycobacterium sp.]|nr:hypothetical protein [Mycobacterium sp.]HUH70162.1 hypothetical protein [Mycobacterium sp.]
MALYYLGKFDLRSFGVCDKYGQRMRAFVDSPSPTPATLEHEWCPYYPDGRTWSGSSGANTPNPAVPPTLRSPVSPRPGDHLAGDHPRPLLDGARHATRPPRRQTQPARPPLRQVVRPAAQRSARLVPPPSSPPKWPSVPLSPPKPAAGFGVTAPTETMTAAHKPEARKRGRTPCRSAIRRRRRSPGATATKKDRHEHGRRDG